MPTFPEWWNWDLSFTGHAELRIEASVVEGRFMIQTRRGQSLWIVIVEPDAEARLLVVVTAYEVSQ
jgi:hypothetical protein